MDSQRKTRVRAIKTTRSQYEMYLEKLQTNTALRDSKFDAKNPSLLKTEWENLAKELNALGGASHDATGWKRVFTDWKSQVRAKARKIASEKKVTGNLGEPIKELTDIENKLLDITGKVVVTGMKNVPELGCDLGPKLQPSCSSSTSYIPVTTILRCDEEIHENKNNEVTLCSSSKIPKKIPAKRQIPMATCIEKLVSSATADVEQSVKIYREIKRIRQNTRHLVTLKQMELKVKYPEYQFELESDLSDD